MIVTVKKETKDIVFECDFMKINYANNVVILYSGNKNIATGNEVAIIPLSEIVQFKD